jgi:putative DNA base modification enzyme with NMAD domain
MRAVDRASRFYVYKLTADNGGAPCTYRGLLSLAICKPSIRRTARKGDWIFGFAGKPLGAGRLIYIAQVMDTVESGAYYVDERFKGRPDRIYRREEGRFTLRPAAEYHSDGSQIDHDLGTPPSYPNAVTLVSERFRYWGGNGRAKYRKRFPGIAALLERLGRGHRVNLSAEVRQELIELRDSEWRAHPRKVLGRPTQDDLTRPCNSSEGGITSCRA